MRLTSLAAALNLLLSSGGPLPPTPIDPGNSGDPNWSGVVSLTHFNLSASATDVVDETGRVWTTTTNPTITADAGALDGYYGRFAGGAYTENTTKADWPFLHNGQSFTIEGFISVDALSGTQMVFNNNAGASANVGIGCWITASGDLRLMVARGVNLSPVLDATVAGVITAGVRKYLTVQYNSATTTYTIFLDGISVYTGSPTQAFTTALPTDSFRYARASSGASALALTGNYDEWRITRGVVRYSGNFTPPATSNPGSGAGDPYAINYATLMHFEGANGSTTFTDQSGKTWTANGTPSISTSWAAFGASSLVLNGSSYLSTANSADHSFSGTNVTFECRIRPTVAAALKAIASKRNSSTAREWTLYHAADGKIHFNVWSSGGGVLVDIASTTVMADLTAYAIAVVKNGSIYYLFINGQVEATADATTAVGTNTAGLLIGWDNAGDTTRKFSGYIDEVRMTQAALYTANYTPRTTAFPDAKVVSQLRFNGAAASTTITDQTGKAWTVSGNAALSTAQVKFGATACAFDGSGDSTQTANHADFDFGLLDFTIEGWCYLSAMPGASAFAFIWCKDLSSGTRGLRWVIDGSSISGVNGRLRLVFQYASGTLTINSLAAFPLNTYTHVAACRYGNTLYMFIGGVLQGTADVTGLALLTNTNPVVMGAAGGAQASTFLNGYLDDWRVTRGLARYTSNYTPPTAELPSAYGWDSTVTSSEFYRLSVTDVQVSGNPVAIAEAHLYTASAEVTYTNVSASSIAGAYPLSNLRDGSAATEFRTADNPSQWILFEVPGGTVLDHITLTPPSAGVGTGTPKNFIVEKLISGVWTTQISATGQVSGWAAGVARTYTVATGTYAADPVPTPPPPTPEPTNPWPTRVYGTTVKKVRDYGALGNGVHDDTAAFKAAIAALPSDGGIVEVAAGTYLVDVNSSTKVIDLRSNMKLNFLAGAKIVVKPNNLERYYTFRIKYPVHDVEISGGEIIGDRVGHLGTTGEWGYGIRVEGGRKVSIYNTKVSNCWGDGVIFGGSSSGMADDLWLYNVISDNNRRQALTIGGAKNWQIEKCTLTNTNGTAPQAGIDVEPDTTSAYNGVIKDCTITGNKGAGILMWQHDSHDIQIINNTVNGNHWGIYGDSVTAIEVTGNICKGNDHQGLRVDKYCSNWKINGNHLGQNEGQAARTSPYTDTGAPNTSREKLDFLINSTATNISVGTTYYE